MLDKQNIRLGLLSVIVVIALLLYNSWQEERMLKKIDSTATASSVVDSKEKGAIDLPSAAREEKEVVLVDPPALATIDPARIVNVKTDVFNLKIDRLGGDLVYINLPKYPAELGSSDGFVLLNEARDRFYVIQSGLLNELGPDSAASGRQLYSINQNDVVMDDGESILNVDMHFVTKTGVSITKRFIFTRGSYDIRVHYIINNRSALEYSASPFARIKRSAPIENNGGFFSAMRTYTGAAINTPEKRYQKISFADMQKKDLKENVVGGWAAMVEHYFASAIVPAVDEKNYFQTEDFGGDIFGITFVSAAKKIAPGMQETIETKIYAGPEVAQKLKNVAPGLELTIDYGWLWFLCQPIFWLLKTMYEVLGNWGLAIIATTIIIKALFYKLSASSYKSMGNMRKVQPKIEALKQRYGEDRQKFSQEMMALYRKEKVNPLGGCLPILIQIPVFIALYYVLLESVELRQAPFYLWIKDLSLKDPYYVLPIIMGLSMFVQQRLNPAPPDPMQAKVLMFMPLFFTFLFLQFPAGLVLYWVVNNLLSILQQWMITRKIDAQAK